MIRLFSIIMVVKTIANKLGTDLVKIISEKANL